jgi:hypothetical protein
MSKSAELAQCLLYLDSELEDDCGHPFCSPHLERLVDEFYEWSDIVDGAMIELGLGDESIDDMWPSVEFVYLCVRLGHGVGFADNFDHRDPVATKLAKLARDAAKSQTYLEDGIYLGDDNMIYLYSYH